VNRPWLNALASVIVSVLLMMSLVLMLTTLFPSINVSALAIILGGLLVVSYVIGGAMMFLNRSRRAPLPKISKQSRADWRLPAINLLQRPTWSRGTKVGMYDLRGYLVIAVIMLLVKAIQLGVHR
jgi:hypothetical protein